jgi:hypothetical protein
MTLSKPIAAPNGWLVTKPNELEHAVYEKTVTGVGPTYSRVLRRNFTCFAPTVPSCATNSVSRRTDPAYVHHRLSALFTV